MGKSEGGVKGGRARREARGGGGVQRELGPMGLTKQQDLVTYKVMNSQTGLSPARAAPTASPPNPDSESNDNNGTRTENAGQLELILSRIVIALELALDSLETRLTSDGGLSYPNRR